MNPFQLEHADPWADDFVDVESLNGAVTDEVIRQIEAARTDTLEGPRRGAVALLLRGPAGSGKTHLFARLRRRCLSRAAFVLQRPEIGVEMDPRLLLFKTVEALARKVYHGKNTQLEIIVGAAFGAAQGNTGYPQTSLMEVGELAPDARLALTEELMNLVEESLPGGSMKYLEQLLRLPFLDRTSQRALRTWLGGTEPSEAQLARLGLGAALSDAELLPALRTLAGLAALHGPLVLVFDQLENLYDADDRSGRISAYANLVAELVDSMPNVVVLQLAVDSEWNARIHPVLSLPQRSRLEGRALQLALPTPDERVELVRRWVDCLPPSERTPFPFSEQVLAAWRTSPMTPRMLLIACRRHLAGEHELPPVTTAPPQAATASTRPASDEGLRERLEEQWADFLQQARAELQRHHGENLPLPAERVAASLTCLSKLAAPAASTTVDRTPVKPSVRIGIGPQPLTMAVLHSRGAAPTAKSLQALQRTALEGPTWVVRDATLAIPTTWKVVEQRRHELLALPGASWVELAAEALAQLLALHDFESAGRSGDLTGPDGAVIGWPLAQEWQRTQLPWNDWTLTADLRAALNAAPTSGAPEPSKATTTSAATPARSGQDGNRGQVLRILHRLHLASIERIVQEARAIDGNRRREEVMAELQAAGDAVCWLGHSLVCTQEVRS